MELLKNPNQIKQQSNVSNEAINQIDQISTFDSLNDIFGPPSSTSLSIIIYFFLFFH